MKFDDETKLWEVTSIHNKKSNKEEINIVLSCVWQLNQPKIPDI